MNTRAKVTVNVEIGGLSPWNEECSASQIKKQAISSAIQDLNQALSKGGNPHIKIIGEPKVTAILSDLN